MVKRAVLSKRQNRSPRKFQKSQHLRKHNNRRCRNSSAVVNLEVDLRKVADTSLPSTSDNVTTVINMNNCDKTDSIMKSDEDSVIYVEDSTIDNSHDTSTVEADNSCFIIDVEPNLNPEEEKSFYKYSLYAEESNNEEPIRECDENNKNCANDVLSSNKNINEILVDSSSSSSEDVSTKSGSGSSSSASSSGSGEDSTSKPAESIQKPAIAIGNQQVEMFSDIVNRMKKDGFFNSGKRCFDESSPNNKRFAHDFGDSKPASWNSFKKKLANSSPKNNSSKTAQNLASKNLSNKFNQNLNTINCVNLADSDSDSDIEFIDSFNPSEKLIELSDDEGSAIVKNMVEPTPPLPVIELPSGKKKKKPQNNVNEKNKAKKKRTKQIKKKEKLKKAKEAKITKGSLRPIVVDGCNVGYGHSKTGMLSVEGIKICYDYFKDRGHDVKVFVPQFKMFSARTSNNVLLKQMERDGIVICTPGRKVDGKPISSYDDRFILEYASLKGAIVVTRDNYRDLYAEKEEFRETIRDRLLQYTFVDDLIMFPDDPLGRTGPRLEEFLRFPPSQTENSEKQNIPSTSKS